MLGKRVADPHGIEGPPSTCDGLGLLDVETELTGDKLLLEVTGASKDGGAPFRGYEMHVGRTTGRDCARPLSSGSPTAATTARRAPTAASSGCYVHGLFADDRSAVPGWRASVPDKAHVRYDEVVEATLDELAAHLERHLDCDALLATARTPRFK